VDRWVGEKKSQVGIVIGQRKTDKVLTENVLPKQTPPTDKVPEDAHFNYSENPSRSFQPEPITEDSHGVRHRFSSGMVRFCI